MKVLLNKKRSKTSTNQNSNMSVGLRNRMKKIPNTTDQHLVDLYQVYLDEKDASDKYRLIFTINPVCSNVLFNAITEVVKDEGSSECEVLDNTGNSPDKNTYPNIISNEPISRIQAIRDTEYSNDKIMGLSYLPGVDIFNNHLIRQNGFNCVMPRNAGQVPTSTGETYTIKDGELIHKGSLDDVFNTIRDYQRTMDGKKVTRKFPGLDSTYLQPLSGQPHLYEDSEILDFETTFLNRISEKDGWFGFYNPSTLDIPVAKDSEDKTIDIYVNKLINNRNACDFIDLFPDRSRYTFVPQKNRYRGNRLEYNWEYCLTYPYSSTEYLIDKDGQVRLDEDGKPMLNPIVAAEDSSGYTRNGLEFLLITEFVTDSDKERILLQSIGCIHNLRPNDTVNIYYYSDDGSFDVITDVSVKGIGDKNGYLQQYFFTIDRADAPSTWFEEDGNVKAGINGRFCKVVFGVESMYYFRVFRRLPNFKEISQDEDRSYYIGKYNKIDFNSELNKLAFANNIYGDNLVQIVYLDDIDVNGLTDNLERPLSDIYLTIVKANDGHEQWYPEEGDPDYKSEEIRHSWPFGKVTSGIDVPPDVNFNRDYNVHRLHNVNYDKLMSLKSEDGGRDGKFTDPWLNVIDDLGDLVNFDSGDTVRNLYALEDDIKIDQEFFLGDMVEFNLSQYQELILEPVYHRFNTAQREYINERYQDIVIDEIYMDDYEGSETGVTQNNTTSIEGNFKCVEDVYNRGYRDNLADNVKDPVTYPGNIFPEGYYYQPHYRIHLKDVSDKLTQSSDTYMYLTSDGVQTGSTGDEVTFTTAMDYDLIVNDEIVIQDPKNNIFYDAIVTEASGVTGETWAKAVLSNGSKLNDGLSKEMYPSSFIVFKKTLGIPKYALHYPDTSGKYIWRSLVPHSKVGTDSEIYEKPFANGAHYRHVGINFFLKRQDPYGEYRLNLKTPTSTGDINKLTNFMVLGRGNESIYYNDAIDFGLLDIC